MPDVSTPDVAPLVRRAGRDRLADRDLLRQFADSRDESAFAELVRRHGPMVLGVCRRALGDHHDAEDAFQATFVALANGAARPRWPESLGGWLHTVARRIASKLRRTQARRLRREHAAAKPPTAEGHDDPLGELAQLLDEEVHRLPDDQREPVVLCYFQGRTRDQAAERIGCSLRTLERRLSQARAWPGPGPGTETNVEWRRESGRG